MACDAPAPAPAQAQAQASRRPRAAPRAAAPRPLRQVALRVWLLSAALLSAPLLPGCLAVPRARDYLKLAGRAGAGGATMARPWGAGAPGREPSCEELLAMWRFSKRQSRATEITNEIAQYRDPFAYNVWEPHARSRSAAGAVIKGARGAGRHVYGRVVHAAPRSRARMEGGGAGGGGGGGGGGRARAYEEVARHLVTYPGGAAPPPPLPPRRRLTAFRFSGGSADPHVAIAPQAGSFQQLKDIIRSERARELQAQRLAEEAAARAAALRDVGLGPAPPPPPPGDEHIRFGRRSLPAAAQDLDDPTAEEDEEEEDAAEEDLGEDEEDAYAKYSEFLAHAVPYGG
ncbi:hypothetical protein R5R35_002924 [Gryllus longicercus]|uniref:Uncharacterized protein n=1 Tax=Gryllus longicercus TaxID=2509291 RepID=A0AAN9Z6Y2_9ORTH